MKTRNSELNDLYTGFLHSHGFACIGSQLQNRKEFKMLRDIDLKHRLRGKTLESSEECQIPLR